MSDSIADLKRRLARDVEAVCRHYLSNGRRCGRYWIVGDLAKGYPTAYINDNGTYDLTIIDAEPFGMSAEEAARIVGAIAPGMPILCLGSGGGGGLDGLPLMTVPADLDAIREMIHHVAA